ncbi:MAG: alpha/beta hydrolase [Clostridiales bacterium]|nr:alpha/beta hydrolase [Clostridiales bacterium]
MKRTDFTIPSSDGRTKLHGVYWKPEGDICGVLQLAHGMVEHIGRYEEIAEFMTESGFAVIGHDHLGHGSSINSEDDLGYFAEQNGDACLIKDMHRITYVAKKLFPDQPVFVLGHSMGSFILRRYLTRFGDEIQGAVICGTGNFGLTEIRMGQALASSLRKKYDAHYRSNLLQGIVLGPMAAQYDNPIRKSSWLSKNEESVRAYREDPLCDFVFTVGAYQDFFRILEDLAKEKDFERIPRELPILLVSGMDDPLGGYTKKVLDVYNHFVAMGMKDVDIYLYPDDRHEVLNELDRDQVHADILNWMERRIDN